MADEQAGPTAPTQVSPEEVAALKASFDGKCCPLGLIALGMPPSTGGLVGPLGQKVQGNGSEMVGCQGPTCMWFRMIKHPESNKVIGGDCVIPLTLGAVAALPSNLAGNLGSVLAQLGKLRFTPNGG